MRKLLLLIFIPFIMLAQDYDETRFFFENFDGDDGLPEVIIKDFYIVSDAEANNLYWDVTFPDSVRITYLYRGTYAAPVLFDSIDIQYGFDWIDAVTQDTIYYYFLVALDSAWNVLDTSETVSGQALIPPATAIVLTDTISIDVIMALLDDLAMDSVRLFRDNAYIYTYTTEETYIDTPLTYTSPYFYSTVGYRDTRASIGWTSNSVQPIALRNSEAPAAIGDTGKVTITVSEALVDSVRLYRDITEGATTWVASLANEEVYIDTPLTAGIYLYRTKNYKSGILSPEYSAESTANVAAPPLPAGDIQGNYLLTENGWLLISEDNKRIIKE